MPSSRTNRFADSILSDSTVCREKHNGALGARCGDTHLGQRARLVESLKRYMSGGNSLIQSFVEYMKMLIVPHDI